MRTKPVAAFCTGTLFLGTLLAQEPKISDPIRDYLDDYETRGGEKLISTKVDLNGDGVDDVFLSRTSLHNGRQGNIWVLYESLPGGLWKRHDTLGGDDGGVIEFHPKAVCFQSDGKGGKTLISYSPGSATSGRLMTFQLRNGAVSQTVRQGEISPGAGDSELFDRYFGNPKSQLTFQMRSMSELRSKYLPFGGWFHQLTAGKLVFLALCLFVPLWMLRGAARFLTGRNKGSGSE